MTREAIGRYPGGVIYLGSDGRWQKLDSQGVQGFAKAPQPTDDGIALGAASAVHRGHIRERAPASLRVATRNSGGTGQ